MRKTTTRARLRSLRRHGMTLRQIAAELGVTERCVQLWMSGAREIRPRNLERLEALVLTAKAKKGATT